MRTDDLVSLLAADAGPVERHAAERRFALAIGGGGLVSVLMMLSLLGLRHDLAEAVMLPMFWVRFAFAAALAAAGTLAALRLARPGRRLNLVPLGLALPVLVMWGLAVVDLAGADAAQRPVLIFGTTWKSCAFLITMLSLPIFAGNLWAMRGLAPTALRLSGAAAGLLAGAVGVLAYCLHCPELSPAFLGIWYVLGMLIPTGIGAWIGPRVLRW